MSVYSCDKENQGLENVMTEYPDGSYFNDYKNEPCTCHTEIKECSYGGCDCKLEDDGIQCAGFARYVFHEVKGRYYTDDRKTRITGFGNRLSYANSDNGIFSGEELSALTAKKYLQGLSVGTYVRVRNRNDSSPYPWHSFAVLETSNNGIVIYQANVGGRCLVTTKSYTWYEFVQDYSHLIFYVD